MALGQCRAQFGFGFDAAMFDREASFAQGIEHDQFVVGRVFDQQ